MYIMAEYTESSFKTPVQADDNPPQRIVPDYPGKPGPRRSKKPLFIGLCIVLLAGLAFGGWKLFGSKKPLQQSTSKPSGQNESNQPSQTLNKDVPEAGGTKEYESGFLGVKVTYPDNWTATESENRDSVRIESPAFSYQTVDKGQVSGSFRIYIRKGARAEDSKYIGRGYAIKDSEKLTYSKPSLDQRKETNLSLFGLDKPTNFAFFLIAGNYSLKKGDTLGPNYGKEAETFIIAGGYSAKDLKDDLATNQVSPEMIESSSAYKQAIDILKSLQLH